jgi:hypothetical protein
MRTVHTGIGLALAVLMLTKIGVQDDEALRTCLGSHCKTWCTGCRALLYIPGAHTAKPAVLVQGEALPGAHACQWAHAAKLITVSLTGRACSLMHAYNLDLSAIDKKQSTATNASRRLAHECPLSTVVVFGKLK